MPQPITQPTKEQVRAYMLAREAARRPPPPPEEIRRQLGWRLGRDEPEHQLLCWCLFPATCGQLAARLTLDWLLASVPAWRK